ncbi:Ribosomal protein L32e like protein [Aduncisulcus paluster]|uniref:Ribosomal protein L32e like protein n=1 Tax=Aduncisulcus paluster TaxID=2918883 RepID=A0ABQ5K5Y5_9EUKA|nr:Ribosomal protein L32e like protein [Aduncisulcus paluster]|eukprot:gnl/Carplike_NY0171/144_a204_7090.p3 GENE.gnl/Carplike_NY0171/144_a204_7090~~gnl/Carplike_NY0171/144_a204_7090.p3  ORF type:complete len:139 (+),score=37.26 gnl/Carplike_NY0171/144_a204_7090:413-829(+)
MKVTKHQVPIKRVKVVKKRTKKFFRHQSDRFMRVGESWRKPKGIDGVVRRRFRGTIPMPNVGYGTCKKHRDLLPCGFRKFRVFNVEDLKTIMMFNHIYAVEIASSVSKKSRMEILKECRRYKLHVLNVNDKSKIRQQE